MEAATTTEEEHFSSCDLDLQTWFRYSWIQPR